MTNSSKIIVIDAGNTSIKAGVFENNTLSSVERFEASCLDKFSEWINSNPSNVQVISSVLSEKDTELLIGYCNNPYRVTAKTKVPFTIDYHSPETLGIDRLCNVMFLYQNVKGNAGVVIDIGTCIKFDFLDKNGNYKGGSIAPGIMLRYKALHDHTGKLPLLSNKTPINIVGMSTDESIQSGVINGIEAEINGIMELYAQENNDLTFFVTGGDASFFDIHSKNDIFADENLTIKGLLEIYKHNA